MREALHAGRHGQSPGSTWANQINKTAPVSRACLFTLSGVGPLSAFSGPGLLAGPSGWLPHMGQCVITHIHTRTGACRHVKPYARAHSGTLKHKHTDTSTHASMCKGKTANNNVRNGANGMALNTWKQWKRVFDVFHAIPPQARSPQFRCHQSPVLKTMFKSNLC